MVETTSSLVARSGRNPNNSSWLILRYKRDWSRGLDGLIFDPSRNVVELEPLANYPDQWSLQGPITDRKGNEYKVDPLQHRILRRNHCESEFEPLPCLGGLGW